MSATMTAAGLVLPMAEDSHFPPTPGDFWQPLFAIPGTAYYFTRPMLLMAIATLVLVVWPANSTSRVAQASWTTVAL